MNIARSRTCAQKRVTGGRWRRIVLGHVLAEHRSPRRGGSPRVSGRRGNGSSEFWQRPHRWVCHRGRSNITLAGSHCRDPLATMSQARSKPVPAPRTRCALEVRARTCKNVQVSVGFSPPRPQHKHPSRAPENVVGANPYTRVAPICPQARGVLVRSGFGVSLGFG